MDKYIYDEKNGLWYELQGDYYLPCLKLPKEESRHIGVWGQRHLSTMRRMDSRCPIALDRRLDTAFEF